MQEKNAHSTRKRQKDSLISAQQKRHSFECLFFISLVRNPLSACPPSSRVSPFCHSAEPYGQGNTRRAHVSRRPLIMPLVALVQKNHSAPATSYFHLVLGTRCGRRRCSSNSVFERVSAYLRTHRICKVRIASHRNCEQSEQYNWRSQYNCRRQYNFAKQNITHKKAPSKGCVFYEFQHSIRLFLDLEALVPPLSLCLRRAPFCRLQQHWVQSLQTFQEVI